jgi:hypothetical protein
VVRLLQIFRPSRGFEQRLVKPAMLLRGGVGRKLRGRYDTWATVTRPRFSKPRTGRHNFSNPVRGDIFVENVEQKEIS